MTCPDCAYTQCAAMDCPRLFTRKPKRLFVGEKAKSAHDKHALDSMFESFSPFSERLPTYISPFDSACFDREQVSFTSHKQPMEA